MKQTEIEFFLARSKKTLIFNFIKFVILLVVAGLFAFISYYYWGIVSILLFSLSIMVYSGAHILILILKIYKNVKDYRILSDLCNYADSLDIQSMENKDE